LRNWKDAEKTLKKLKIKEILTMIEKKTLKNATLAQLKNWLMETEMSDSFTKYEETIKQLRTEIAKRENNGKKIRKPRPRKMQEITIEHFVHSDDETATQICESATVKALNEFIKKNGLKIKRSLRKAEKITAILEWRRTFRNLSETEQLEAIKAGNIDRNTLLALCKFDAVYRFAESLSISVESSFGFLNREAVTSKIIEKLAA